MNDPSWFVQFMFDEMRRQGLKPAQLARRSGLTPPTLTYWKEGHRQPRIGPLVQCLKTLGFELTIIPAMKD